MTLETEPQLLQLANMGLFTMPNALSKVPQGSLLLASNVVVDYDGLLSNRRGMTQFGAALVDAGNSHAQNVFQIFQYKGTKIIWTGDNLAAANATDTNNHLLWYDSDGNGTWTLIEKGFPGAAMNNAPVNTDRYHSAEGNSNIYYTTTAGIYKQDDPATAPYPAGGLPGLDGTYALTGSSGFMSTNTEVAYRMVWQYTDANNNLILGAPSTRLVAVNASGGSRNVIVTFTIPRAATSGLQFQIYRSVMSASSSTEPDDNLQLAVSGTINGTDISNGYFSVTDSTPEGSLQAFLYTNAGQSTNPGENLPNTPPPLSLDMCFYKQYMLYGGNCQTQQTFLMSMLATGSPSGIQIGDTITIMRVNAANVSWSNPISTVTVTTLTGDSSETPSTGHFKVTSGGTPADDILATKESLIRVINRYLSNTVAYAFDASTSDTTSLPGDFYLQEQGVGGGVFYIYSSRSTWSFPSLSAILSFSVSSVTDATHLVVSSTSGISVGDVIYQGVSTFATVETVTDSTHLIVDSTTGFSATTTFDVTVGQVSKAGGQKNYIFCSKFSQTEAVPLTNSMAVGNPNYDTIRILPLRDSTIVLKEDGLFRLSGETFPFTVTTLDTSVILTAPESPAVLNNQVYAYTNQGVVAISETGPGIISRPIENVLQQISSYLYPNFAINTIGTNYQTDRKYILSTISSTNTYERCSICYVYNTITQTWTNYTYPTLLWDLKELIDERLYLGSANLVDGVLNSWPYVFQEKKSFNARVDAADIEIPTTLVSSSGTTVTVSSTTGAVVGWSLAQLSLGEPSVPPQIIHISKITGIVDSTHLTVADNIAWSTDGTFTAYEQPIPISGLYTPIHCGSANIVKMFQEIQGYFQNINFGGVTFKFSSDFITSTTPTVLAPRSATTGWGSFPWGSQPWGGGAFVAQALRTYIPLSARRAHWLNLGFEMSEAMSTFTFAGFGLTYRSVSTRSK